MTDGPWRIDPGLAADLAAALGWAPEDGAGALARRFAERIPTGSTAKLAALAEGRVPPGAEVDALAQQILENLTGPARSVAGSGALAIATKEALGDAGAGESDARRESPAWTCWVVSSVFAAIVDTLGPAMARVAALRRIDARAPVVDIHSVVIVEHAGRTGTGGPDAATWVCDPYFGAAVTMTGGLVADPDPSAAPTMHASPPDEHAGACTVALEVDGRWTFGVRLHGWDVWLRYRVLAPRLDRADLAAFCAISATHSGAPDFSYARLHRPGGLDTVRVDPDGTTTLSRRSWDEPNGAVVEDRTTVGTWAEGVAAFAAATGVTIRE